VVVETAQAQDAEKPPPTYTKLVVVVKTGDPPQPVVGANVNVSSLEQGETYDETAFSGPEGRATFLQAPRGKVRVVAIHERTPTFGKDFILDRDEQTIEITLVPETEPTETE
jgi:hypothetical protein